MKAKRLMTILSLMFFLSSLFMMGSQVSSVYAGEGQACCLNGLLDKIEEAGSLTPVPKLKSSLLEKNLWVQPYYRQRMDYTSNVFNSPNAKEDVVWVFTPGFKAEYRDEKIKVGGGYEADFSAFTKYSKQNSQDQSFQVYSLLTPTDATYLRVSEQMAQRGATAGDKNFEPVDYLDNTVDVTAGYRMGKATMQYGYENYNHHFQSDIADRYSYVENRNDWRLMYQATDKIRPFAGFRLGFVEFDDFASRDTIYYEFPFGFEGQLPWGILANVQTGPHRRNLQNTDRNDFNAFVTSTSLKKSFHNKTTVEVSFLRRPVESSFENQTVYDEKLWYAGMNHLMNQKWRGRAGISYSNRDFEENSFIGPRFSVANTTFISAQQVIKRSDDVFNYSLGTDYIVRKWLILNLDYRYSRRDSNAGDFDATEHRLSLGTTIPL